MPDRGNGDRPRLRLIRHGQASLGSDDYDRLSELGWAQARQLGAHLAGEIAAEPSAAPLVLSGSMRRHLETLESLAIEHESLVDRCLDEYGLRELIMSALAEADRLELPVPESRILSDPVTHLPALLEWFPSVLAVWQQGRLDCAYNGTWQSFRDRVVSPVADWRSALMAGREVVVVSSAGVISAIAAELLDRPPAWQRELNVTLYNGSLTELVPREDGKWRALRVNCVRHFEQPELHTLA
ncbi:MAG: histidine phosphatase family protein [Wenzhouxiangella sp.]|nr:histidine phosphatase family protein [Wenzhouxiangella sp.]